jgi:hypothetical protein
MPELPEHKSGDGKKTVNISAKGGVKGKRAVKGVRKIAKSKTQVKKA